MKVGLVGAGAVAQVAHIPAYKRLRSIDLVALCDVETAKLRALRERTGVRHAVTELDDLLALDELDAVDICLPNHLHADAVVRALEAGKDVLCEKPLAPTAEGVERIVAAAEASGKSVLVGMNNRYRDDSIALKEVVEEGALGEVYSVRAEWRKRREPIRTGTWHYRREMAGGGVMMDLGIHLVDQALWLTDHPRVDRVSAAFWKHNSEIEVEDAAVAMIRCAGGLTIVVEASWYHLAEEEEETRLLATEGSASLHPLRLFRRMHGTLVDVTPAPRRRPGNVFLESYEREIAFFAEVVAGRETAPPLSESLALARVMEAVRRSAETGREVELGDRAAE